MTRNVFFSAVALSVALGSMQIAGAASNAKFEVEGSEESRVQFISNAPLEKISGVGHKVTGNIDVDPGAIGKAKGTIELDVASIRTSVDLRDDHLRSDAWLDAKKYPKIKFELGKIEGADKLTPNQAVDVTVKGKLTMHGVTREETATAKVRYIPEKGIRIQANFKVNLTNYKVSVPSVVRLKVSDEIELNVMLAVKPKG